MFEKQKSRLKRAPSALYRALRAVKPLRSAVRKIRDFLGLYRLLSWFLEGTERYSGQPLRIYFAGHLESKNYIAGLAFAGSHTDIPRGRIWLWSAFRLTKNRHTTYDLSIIEMEVSLGRRLKSADAFVIPCWIRGELELAVADTQLKKSESVKTDFRKIRQHGYRYEVTKDEREIDRFYYEMYLPYAQRVYAGMTYLLSYADMNKAKGRYELISVKQDSEEIAGLILLYEESLVRAWMLGVKEGDPAHVKSGALAAVYCFAIQHLIERGNRMLHLGGSRPFLRDGVLQYKKKWGTQIVDHSAKWFVLNASRHTVAVKSFLANNPFFFETDGVLSGAIFVAKDIAMPDDAVRRWHKDFVDLGILHVKVFDLAEWHEPQSGLKLVVRTQKSVPEATQDS